MSRTKRDEGNARAGRLLVARSALVGLFLISTAHVAHSADGARIRPTGVRAVLGLAFPDDLDTAFVYGAAVGLGSIFQPWLDFTMGFTRWSSDLNAKSLGERTAGSLADTRVFADVGIEFFEISGVRGKLDVGLALHFLGGDVPTDRNLEEALGGTNVGAEIGYGLHSTRGKLRLSAELSRQFVDDASNWSFVLGIGTRWDGAGEDE